MGRWIRRSLWCIALGFVTAWLVAWGLTVGMWAGWYQRSPTWAAKGVGVVEPWLLERDVYQYPGREAEWWSGDRLNREYPASHLRRRNADRVLEVGGAAYAEERQRDALHFAPQLEAMLNKPPGSMTNRLTDAIASMPPIQRIDDQIASFPLPDLARRMAVTQADHFFVFAERVGWPIPMLESVGGHEITFAGSTFNQTDFDESQIKIEALKRPPRPGMQPVALSLPFGVIASAAVTNTIFFAASWFALFTGFELLRSLRRRMAGRCVRCGYDLRRVIGKTCPECGRTKK